MLKFYVALIGSIATMISIGASMSMAQGVVTPEARARLDREFAAAHPQPGDYLPSLNLRVLDKDRKETVRHAEYGEVKLVVTASLTCPKTRQHFPALQELKKHFEKRLGITVVYVIEAHPQHDLCPYLGVVDVTEANMRDKLLIRQPLTFEGRSDLAAMFSKRYPVEGTLLIDSMDNAAWKCLGQSPNAAILATADGRVFYRQGWVEPVALKEAIEQALEVESKHRQYQELRFSNERNSTASSELKEIIDRLAQSQSETVHDYENQWDLVRWLETVNSDKLGLLIKRYPSFVNQTLTYGAHSGGRATVLELMIAGRDLEKVKILVKAGADINLRSPIATAIAQNELPIVQYLVEQGAKLDSCSVDDSSDECASPLHFALKNGRLEIARWLSKQTPNIDFFCHCGLGNLEIVQELIEATPSVGLTFDHVGHIPLSYATINNQVKVAQLLLDRGCFLREGYAVRKDSIELAIENPDTTILKLLLARKLSMNEATVEDSLHAERYDHFQLLLQNGVDLRHTRNGMSMLHLVVQKKLPPKFLNDLIQQKMDLNQLTAKYRDNEDGCGPPRNFDRLSSQETPLHRAARSLLPEHAELLLANGAKPDETDATGLSPLAAAILTTLENDSKEGLKTIQALIDGGCSINAVDSKSVVIREQLRKLADAPPRSQRVIETRGGSVYEFVVPPAEQIDIPGFDVLKVATSPLATAISRLLVTRLQ